MPGTSQLMLQLKAAIANDTRPQDLFYQFISNGSMEANYLVNQMRNNKEIIRLITSPQGRAWIKRWVDSFLNYLQKFGA